MPPIDGTKSIAVGITFATGAASWIARLGIVRTAAGDAAAARAAAATQLTSSESIGVTAIGARAGSTVQRTGRADESGCRPSDARSPSQCARASASIVSSGASVGARNCSVRLVAPGTVE